MSLIKIAAKYGFIIVGFNSKNTNKNIICEDGTYSSKKIQDDLKEMADGEDIALCRSLDFTSRLCSEAKELQKEKEASSATPLSDGIKKVLDGLILYQDAAKTRDKEPNFFLGTPEGIVSHIPAHLFINAHKIQDPENMAIPAVAEYAPRGIHGEYDKEIASGETLTHVNTYIPPKWKNYEGELPDELPETFRKTIEHIFPKQIDRDYFFHWTYKSLTSRAETYLILQGAGGIGKNRLKIALRALHGHLNSADGKKSTLTTQFNSQLGENTLLYFDELSYTEKEENVMKEIPNGTVPIEAKFKDPTKGTRIFCSMVIANNKEKDNYIDVEARKFTPLELTTIPLDRAMSSAEIEEMSAKMEFPDDPRFDIAYIAQIGRWILKHGEDKRWPNCEYRGPRFWALANITMSVWKKKILEAIFDPHARLVNLVSGPFKYSAFQTIHSKEVMKKKQEVMNIDYSRMEYFFDTFRDMEGDRVFSIEKIGESVLGDFIVEIIKRPVLASASNVKKITERPEDLL